MSIDVVIPYFDAPQRLTSILLALDAQVDAVTSLPLTDLEVIVADDNSTVPPDLVHAPMHVRVVRTEEDGYHVAAARNRGAADGSGDVIVFLDGDTVPSPTYISRLIAPLRDGRAGLTCGHRSHADFNGLDPSEVAAFAAAPVVDRRLAEPTWLADGMRWTDGLTSARPEVFQYVISAVLAVERRAFDSVGGFDESFDSYGGEDWEFAYRCWNDGWDFEYVADAVAWHDGPDVEGRIPDRRAKTIENLRIASLVPASPTRVPRVGYTVPDVDIGFVVTDGQLHVHAIGLSSLLRSDHTDFRVRLLGSERAVADLSRHVTDARVACSSPPDRRARCHALLTGPVEFSTGSLRLFCDGLLDATRTHRRTVVGEATFDAWSVRRANSAARRGRRLIADECVSPESVGVRSVDPSDDLAAWCRRQRTTGGS